MLGAPQQSRDGKIERRGSRREKTKLGTLETHTDGFENWMVLLHSSTASLYSIYNGVGTEETLRKERSSKEKKRKVMVVSLLPYQENRQTRGNPPTLSKKKRIGQ
jgi:hypothetical protein